MVKKKITWIAENNDIPRYYSEFSTEKKAIEAEEIYNINKNIQRLSKIFRIYFKLYYNKDESWNKFIHTCVDCNIKLLEREEDFDGYDRTYLGKTIYQKEGNKTFLDGYRCEKCDKKVYNLLVKMFDYYNKKNNTKSAAKDLI